MSDARELAARLRTNLCACDICAEKNAAADELKRLADVEAERDRLRAALVRWRFSPDIEMNGSPLAKALIHETDALLASAGPPQEVTDLAAIRASQPATDEEWAEISEALGITDPPPERRCTCEVIHDPTLDRLGRKRVDRWGRADPACPEHGR